MRPKTLEAYMQLRQRELEKSSADRTIPKPVRQTARIEAAYIATCHRSGYGWLEHAALLCACYWQSVYVASLDRAHPRSKDNGLELQGLLELLPENKAMRVTAVQPPPGWSIVRLFTPKKRRS